MQEYIRSFRVLQAGVIPVIISGYLEELLCKAQSWLEERLCVLECGLHISINNLRSIFEGGL